MMKKISAEKIVKPYVEGSLKTFLKGKGDLNWVTATIKVSNVRGEKLKNIFCELKKHGDSRRYQQVYQECRKQGWFKEKSKEEESKLFTRYKSAMTKLQGGK
ncbi:MAG: hypothetical protein QMC80_04765 [Thermoplasmatales archaeon]|nr:hypothetical protein [Thermoplasmatales archaeon]